MSPNLIVFPIGRRLRPEARRRPMSVISTPLDLPGRSVRLEGRWQLDPRTGRIEQRWTVLDRTVVRFDRAAR